MDAPASVVPPAVRLQLQRSQAHAGCAANLRELDGSFRHGQRVGEEEWRRLEEPAASIVLRGAEPQQPFPGMGEIPNQRSRPRPHTPDPAGQGVEQMQLPQLLQNEESCLFADISKVQPVDLAGHQIAVFADGGQNLLVPVAEPHVQFLQPAAGKPLGVRRVAGR